LACAPMWLSKSEHRWQPFGFTTQGWLKWLSIGSLVVPVGLLAWWRYRTLQPLQQQRQRKRHSKETSETSVAAQSGGSPRSIRRAKKAQEKAQREARQSAKRERVLQEGKDLAAMLEQKIACADAANPLVFVAIDVEAWEEDKETVTEIGIAAICLPLTPVVHRQHDVENQTDAARSATRGCFHHRHILVREYLEMRNGKFIADNRDHFLFGDSEVLHLADAVREVQAELSAADFIVGLAMQGDLSWLRSIGVGGLDADADIFQSRLVDIQLLDCAHVETCQDPLQPPGLRALAERFNLDPQRLHNAGNDAAFTLQVALSQCKVSFDAPQRSTSRHCASASFQAAEAEAQQYKLVVEKDWVEREDQLRAEVRAFAERLQGNQLAAAATTATTECSTGLLEHSFEALSPKERRVVHKAAEELGLQSVSRNDGAQGERSVIIRRKDAEPRGGKRSRWHRRRR